jgi:protocatechuate 3,4-dioxygenase beta subunit
MVSNQYTVRLEPGTTLSGTVVDENGHPLLGVQVGALGSGGRGYSQSIDPSGKVTSPPEKRVEDVPEFYVGIEKPGPDSVFTDRAGRFQFTHFPSDLRSLFIELLGDDGVRRKFRTPEGRKLIMKLTGEALPEVSLQELRQGTARLVLLRGLTIDGVVVDAGNNPVMDATVTENRLQQSLYHPFSRTNTDYAGCFRLPNIPPREIVLAASAEGFASVLTNVVVQSAMASVRIQLPPEQPLRGRVVNEAGEPAADVAVKASDVTKWGLNWSGKTDADGRFSWLGAPLSEIAVWIEAGDRDSRMFRFSASKEEHLMTLRTGPLEAVRITGKVTNALTGEPVDNFRVGVAQDSTGGVLDPPLRTIDGWHGVFDVQVFQSDIPVTHHAAWGLRIMAKGYDPICTRLYDFAEGDQQLEFALQPGGFVEGVVQSPEGGVAANAQLAFVANHRSIVLSQVGQLSRGDRAGNSDAEGRFKLAKPVEPQALVVFHDSGWAVVPLAKAAGSLPVRLLPWGRIEGTVVNGQTRVAGEYVSLQKLVWSWSDALAPLYSASAMTDDTGHFAFEKVPAGEFQISLTARAWQRRGELVKALETAVRIAAGETQTVKLWTSGQSVIARLHGPPSIARPAWTNASAVLRRDVIVPPEPAQSDYVSDTSLRAARDRYAHDPTVLAALREARSYVGAVAFDGLVTFANIPPGRYALEVQLFTERNELRPSGGVEENSVAARVRAAVSVPETTNTSDDTSVSIGDFTMEPL